MKIRIALALGAAMIAVAPGCGPGNDSSSGSGATPNGNDPVSNAIGKLTGNADTSKCGPDVAQNPNGSASEIEDAISRHYDTDVVVVPPDDSDIAAMYRHVPLTPPGGQTKFAREVCDSFIPAFAGNHTPGRYEIVAWGYLLCNVIENQQSIPGWPNMEVEGVPQSDLDVGNKNMRSAHDDLCPSEPAPMQIHTK